MAYCNTFVAGRNMYEQVTVISLIAREQQEKKQVFEHSSLPWRICDRADEPFALTRNRLATLHSVKWALVVPDKEAWFTKKAWTDFIILTKSQFTQVIPRYHNWHRDSHKRGQADATWPDTWHRDTREAILSNLPLLLAHIAHMCSIWQRVCS